MCRKLLLAIFIISPTDQVGGKIELSTKTKASMPPMPPGVESNTKKTQIGRLTKTVSSSGQVTTVEERPHLAVNDTGELVIQEWKRNNNGNSSASSNEVWGASSKQVPTTMSCIKI